MHIFGLWEDAGCPDKTHSASAACKPNKERPQLGGRFHVYNHVIFVYLNQKKMPVSLVEEILDVTVQSDSNIGKKEHSSSSVFPPVGFRSC